MRSVGGGQLRASGRPPGGAARVGMVGATAGVLALLVVACGGAAANTEAPATSTPIVTPAPTAPPTPKPTPTPEPTLDLGALGDDYLALAKFMGDTLTPLYDELAASDHPQDEYVALNKGVADAYTQAAATLRGLTFPAGAQADADELAGVLDSLANEFQMVVDDTSYDNLDAVNALLPKVPEIGARIRAALGLPPPPTPEPT